MREKVRSSVVDMLILRVLEIKMEKKNRNQNGVDMLAVQYRKRVVQASKNHLSISFIQLSLKFIIFYIIEYELFM